MSNKSDFKKNLEVRISYQQQELRFWLPRNTRVRHIVDALIQAKAFQGKFDREVRYGLRYADQGPSSPPLEETQTLRLLKMAPNQALLLSPLTLARLEFEVEDSRQFFTVQPGATLVYNQKATRPDIDLAQYTNHKNVGGSGQYARLNLNTNGQYVLQVLYPTGILVNNHTCTQDEVILLESGMSLTFNNINVMVSLHQQ